MNLLVNELHSRGQIVALVPINKSGEDLVRPVCPVFALDRTWKGGLVDFVRSYFRFLRVIKLWEPTVVILNCDLPELFGALNLRSVPRLIVVEHTSRPFASRKILGKVIRKILEKKKSEFVVVSSHLSIWQISTKAQAVLLNAIKLEPETFSSFNSSKSSKIQNIYFIGRLASIQKRPQIMLEIASMLQNKIIIIGDGEAKAEIKAKILRESLNVELLGYLKNPWKFIEQNDVLIVPSLFEGDGMVVIEAIARDLPLLLSDTPDFRRFGFPNANYCIDSADFVKRLTEYELRINDLRVPAQTRREILNSRTPKAVGVSWVNYLNYKSK